MRSTAVSLRNHIITGEIVTNVCMACMPYKLCAELCDLRVTGASLRCGACCGAVLGHIRLRVRREDDHTVVCCTR